MSCKNIAAELNDYVIAMRRELHMHPEMPLEEKWTSGRICEELKSFGIPYEIVGKYNVIGKIDCGEGKKIAIRADIDALPVVETLDVPWKSQNDGCMHACGHDAHTAILLAVGKGLMQMKDKLKGTIYLCFQEAEEFGRCADECVDYLVKVGGVDNAIGLHLSGSDAPGTIELVEGARFSGAEIFYIDVLGKGGHGSRPDLVIDPIRIAADIYQKIIAIPTNSHSMFDTCVVSPCMLSGGNRFNVFPDTAHIEGTIRYYKEGDGAKIVEKIEKISTALAEMNGAKAVVKSEIASKYPVINEPVATEKGRAVAQEIGLKFIDGRDPQAASDNFAEFIHEFPGFYCFLGANSSRVGTSGNHHTTNFDIDESVLVKGIEFFMTYTEKFLG